MLLGSDILRLFFTGPYLASSPLCSVSGVDCPSVDPRQLPLLVSCHQLPTPNCLCCLPLCSVSGVDCPSVDPCHQLFSLLSNYQLWSLPLSGSRRQLSFSSPLTTSGYGEISCPRILCLVSRQNRQLNRLLWQPTHIVLHLPIYFIFKILPSVIITVI